MSNALRTLFVVTVAFTASTTSFAQSAQRAPTASADKRVTAALVEARTHMDSHWYGEKAFLFRASGLKATPNLAKKRIMWTIDVKRKLADWSTAKSWLVVRDRVQSTGDVNDIAYALTYRNLAKAKFLAGEHEAAFVGTVDGEEVFRNEIRFVLPGAGPNAYDPRKFKR